MLTLRACWLVLSHPFLRRFVCFSSAVAGEAAGLLSEFRKTHSAGARFLMSKAVQFSSSKQYASHWSNWRQFISQWVPQPVESDFYLLRRGGGEDDLLPMRLQVETLAAFCHFCITVLRHKANTVVGHLSGVRHWFRTNGLSLAVFSHPSLLAAKTGLMLQQRQQESLADRGAAAARRKLPCTLHMVEDIVKLRVRSSSMLDQMVAVATQLAFFCLLRVSEYVPHYNKGEEEFACHAMLASDVEFELVSPDGRHSTVPAHRVSGDMWPCVSLVRFQLRHSKNDRMRVGSIFWFRNLVGVEGINIVRSVFDWVCLSQPVASSYLFSYRDGSGRMESVLRYNDMSKAVKLVAAAHGFRECDFGTHSLRVGGACLLRAGAAPDSMIQLLGRWKSLVSCLGYQESSMREFDVMQCLMRNNSLFTAKDIRLFHVKSGA